MTVKFSIWYNFFETFKEEQEEELVRYIHLDLNPHIKGLFWFLLVYIFLNVGYFI